MKGAGIHVRFYVSPKTGHEWQSWRRGLREFASLLFQELAGQWHAQFETAIGLQTYHFDFVAQDGASLGLKVSVTELDVTIRGASGGQFGGGFGRRDSRASTPASAEDLDQQAKDYAKLFAIFAKHKDLIERVTFWGLHDRRSWRQGQHPLILDANGRPKPAYAAIVNGAEQRPRQVAD